MGSRDGPSPLVIEKSEVILVKPSKPTPNVTLSLSTIDNNFDLENPVAIVFIFASKPNLHGPDLTVLLQQALSKALVYYYPFAGKLHRRSDNNKLELNCSADDGVPFIKAAASCTLSSLNYFETIDHYNVVNKLVHIYPMKGRENYDLLALQMTEFACGGFSLGVTHSHSVCDGIGFAQFFRAYLELTSDENTQPTLIPVWDRERLPYSHLNDITHENNNETPKLSVISSVAATSPYIGRNDIIHEILSFTAEDIIKLKKKSEVETNFGVTTFEVIAAHVWRARCKALELSREGTVYLKMAINIRKNMDLRLQEGYYGNVFVSKGVRITTKELSEMSLGNVARRIKEAKKMAMKKENVLEELSEIETSLKENKEFKGVNESSMTMITDWRHVGLHHDDLGGLVNMIPVLSVKVHNICFVLPASKVVAGNEGGVRVLVELEYWLLFLSLKKKSMLSSCENVVVLIIGVSSFSESVSFS